MLQERKKACESHFKEILCYRRGRRRVRVTSCLQERKKACVTLRRSCVAGEEEGV